MQWSAMKQLILVGLAILAAVTGTLVKKVNPCGYKCASHTECPPEHACISHKCADPCQGLCGSKALCKVVDHIPVCACQEGYSGDPFHQCELESVACPNNTWPPVKGGTKKFWVETIKMADWTEAVMFCMQKGQRLATITTQQELSDLKEAIGKTRLRHQQFWLAGTDHLYENEWIWFPSGEHFTVTDWHLHEPNSGGEDCLEAWERNDHDGYKWNDRPCHEKHFLVCEYYE